MRLDNIQVLRAIAAYSVVLHHALDALANYFPAAEPLTRTHVFACGVDIFFVISGVIIAESTFGKDITPARFMSARLIRIVPSYALLTIAAFGIRALGFKLFARSDTSLSVLLRSLTFMPIVDDSGRVQAPILFVGWSLNYEMLFYVLFAITLLLRNPRWRPVLLASLVFVLVSLGAWSDDPYLGYWGDTIALEFVFGISVWWLTRGRPAPRWLAAGLGSFALGALAMPAVLGSETVREAATLRWGLPAAVIVWAAVSLEHSGWALRSPFLLRQGDASFALYLVHPFVLQALGKASVIAGIVMGVAAQLAFCGLTFLVAGVVGLAFHHRIEKPMGRWLRARFEAPRPVPVDALQREPSL
jgi:exopolysaccharide production protein ExoZ